MKSKIVTLDELGEFKNGLNFNKYDYGEGYPIINVKQLYQSRFASTKNLLSIRKDFGKKIDNYTVKKGDLLFARGSMVAKGAGQVVMVNDFKPGTVFSGFIIRFRVNDEKKINPLFLNYILRSPKYRGQFVRLAEGSVHSNFNQEILGNFKIELPSIHIQNIITNILGKIDDSIELLQTLDSHLEDIIKTFFKSWFIDFDGQTEFIDSELGKIPKGWKCYHTDEIKKEKKGIVSGPFGSNIGSRFFQTIGIPVIRGNNLTIGKEEFIDAGFVYITQEKAEELKNCQAIQGDIVFTAVGTLGQVGIIPIYSKYEKYVISNKQLRLRIATDIATPFYCYYWYSYPDVSNFIINQNKGTSVPLINLQVLKSIPIIIPPLTKMKEFEKLVEHIKFTQHNLRQKIDLLSEVRDLILPKLMSGEIRI
ncbi:Type-1 restriction enzyme StySJI specificity protein [Marine Group I thaumarchaeote SCGC AAA799-N04]|uniref:Type-1 restriction enzyme StySJI specificity protein n=1 Tax=Marine Group I thaumarchaeote SCGC AAA799-N04 TaxID=1502293 RepID=A0A081RMH2_9ARCH|nr:Type-1 restriction enzyme StySJI specificity protein [Marine Group I thaumarchaeote SCGC AAA799-N04]